MNKFLYKYLLSSILILHLASCKAHQAGGHSESLVKFSDTQISFKINHSQNISLGARLYSPKKHPFNAIIIMVPGSGNVSRLGTIEGDGVHNYNTPFDVTHERSIGLARSGFTVLSYDKRSCTPSNDTLCNDNFLDDIKTIGPKALAQDVNGACEYVLYNHKDKKLILWGSDQATQVILSSECATKADLLVFASPITQRIDKFMTEGLEQAAQNEQDDRIKLKLTRRYQSLSETFISLEKGLFPKEANVLGASVEFWHAWLKLTEQPFANSKKLSAHKLYLTSKNDLLMSTAAKTALKQAVKNHRSTLMEFQDVDRNLLKNAMLSNSTEEAIISEIISILNLAS